LLYIVSAILVAGFSGLLSMAGLGAAFIFVPLFYYLGVPLPEAASTALLLNVVSLSVATVTYWRRRLVDVRLGLPVLVTAVLLAPVGAGVTTRVDQRLLLALFVGFLVFAGAIMLFYRPRPRLSTASQATVVGVGGAIGAVAGFLGGLLGVGGGNIVLPGLTLLGLDTKLAAGTTGLVVVFSSFSGFLGHAAVGHLDPLFLAIMTAAAAVGSLAGSRLMTTRITSRQLKVIIGVLLWVVAAKMALDLI